MFSSAKGMEKTPPNSFAMSFSLQKEASRYHLSGNSQENPKGMTRFLERKRAKEQLQTLSPLRCKEVNGCAT